jgi:hypothetical protein
MDGEHVARFDVVDVVTTHAFIMGFVFHGFGDLVPIGWVFSGRWAGHVIYSHFQTNHNDDLYQS